jgi:hypothetical protein
MNSSTFTCVISHLIALQFGCGGGVSSRRYHTVYGEFPCSLVGDCLNSVVAVVC